MKSHRAGLSSDDRAVTAGIRIIILVALMGIIAPVITEALTQTQWPESLPEQNRDIDARERTGMIVDAAST